MPIERSGEGFEPVVSVGEVADWLREEAELFDGPNAPVCREVVLGLAQKAESRAW